MIWGSSGAGPVDDARLLELYDWPSVPWLRAMMVTALDGAAAGSDGTSKPITGAADQRVFNGVRRFADAVLVGAGTVRAEGYGALVATSADRKDRLTAGQAPAPVLAIVSRTLDLPWTSAMFTGSEVRPIVITGSGADPGRLAVAEQHADLTVVASPNPSGPELLQALTTRGLGRVVCEGGPTLLRTMLAAGLVDEADITVAPRFAGVGPEPGEAFPSTITMRLVHVLQADGFVMNRYVRQPAGGGDA